MGASECTLASQHLSSLDVTRGVSGDGEKDALSRSRTTTRRKSTGRSASLNYLRGRERLPLRHPRVKTEDEAKIIAESLMHNPNIKRRVALTAEQIDALVEAAWKEVAEPGQVIMIDGDLDNNRFWIVTEGSCEVTASVRFDTTKINDMTYLSRPAEKSAITGKIQRRLGRMSSFGDSSMFYNAPRWGSVRAVERSTVWVLCQDDFKRISPDLIHPKSEDDVKMLSRTLLLNANLRRMTPLSAKHVEQLTAAAWPERLAKGTQFLREGDLDIDRCYVISSGKCLLTSTSAFQMIEEEGTSYITRANVGREDVQMVKEVEVGRGCMIGEISMLYCKPRSVGVVALEDSVVFAIDRATFQNVQMTAAEDELKERTQHVKKLKVLKPLGPAQLSKVILAIERVSFSCGDVLYEKGQDGSSCYMIIDGMVAQSASDYSGSIHMILAKDASSAKIFGEHMLEGDENQKRRETLTIKSSVATALILEREALMKVWDECIEQASGPDFTRFVTSVSKKVKASEAMKLQNLQEVGLLGVSRLGPIQLVRHTGTKQHYALKKMSKGRLVQCGLRRTIITEKAMWMVAPSPFIVRLHATLEDPQHLCFVFEAVLGGELALVYARQNFFGNEEHTRFYLAGSILGMSALHESRAIYRNLKPQNVLVSSTGLPKLADMSLAKLVDGRTFTTLGARDYMAPEIIAGVGHGRGVDFWAAGIMTFELLFGYSPFESEKFPMETYLKVMNGVSALEFPSDFSSDAKDFIVSLLQPTAVDRLGMKAGGLQNIKDHPWYSKFDWKAMEDGKLTAPYVPTFNVTPDQWKDLPELDAADCCRHFQPDKPELPNEVIYEDDDSMWSDGFAQESI